MTAIILTESQAAAFAVEREPNATRILEPRRLDDGRLILNADVLGDPHFSDPTKPWAHILAGRTPADLKADPEAAAAVAESLVEMRSEVVTLTGTDLPELK